MKVRQPQLGFSLVEILISLFVVSITAVCVIRLQKEITDQTRDTYIYSAVLNIAMSEIDDKIQGRTLADIDTLNGIKKQRILAQTNTELTLDWFIQGINNNQRLRQVTLKINWLDSAEKEQSFNYQLKALGIKLGHVSTEVASVEASNNWHYFSPKVKYKAGDIVIYNSQLFKADSDQKIGSLPDQTTGWENKGGR